MDPNLGIARITSVKYFDISLATVKKCGQFLLAQKKSSNLRRLAI